MSMLFESAADHILLPDSFAMLEHIIEWARASFSRASANQEFFDYYLESGQTLLVSIVSMNRLILLRRNVAWD